MTKTKTLHATFDGEVLRPEESVDSEVAKRYVLTIESRQKITSVETDPAFDLSSLAVKMDLSDE